MSARLVSFILAMVLMALPAAPRAEVIVTFWSHSRDQNYPHAFIVMHGQIDATGQRVSRNIGFTARHTSPMILVTSVPGMMQTLSRSYLARATSRPHFQLRVDDAGYARLNVMIERWRAYQQPAYNLNTRNCVHFVMEVAATLGLNVNRRTPYVRQPAEFLDEVMRLNPGVAPATR